MEQKWRMWVRFIQKHPRPTHSSLGSSRISWPMVIFEHYPATSLALESGEGLAARKSFPAQRFNLRCAKPLKSVGGTRHRRPGRPKMVRNPKNKILRIVSYCRIFSGFQVWLQGRKQGEESWIPWTESQNPRGIGATAHTAAAQPALASSWLGAELIGGCQTAKISLRSLSSGGNPWLLPGFRCASGRIRPAVSYSGRVCSLKLGPRQRCLLYFLYKFYFWTANYYFHHKESDPNSTPRSEEVWGFLTIWMCLLLSF